LAGLLGNSVSHDRIQRLLAQERLGSAELWQVVKPYVRQIEQANGVIIIDDSFAEKPYTDENDIICWHFDHSQNRSVKGINFMTCLYHAGGYSLPVGFTIVAKTEFSLDKKDGKQKRRSPIGKNEHDRDLLRHAKQNQIPFKYVLSDVWYSAADNMTFIKLEWLRKTTKLNHFALKSKLYVAALHSVYAILRQFQPIQFAA
jgi:hypothetical protein